MNCILGMEFITYNNVLIEGHNRLVRIPSKNGIVRVKAHDRSAYYGWINHPLDVRKNLRKRMHGRLWHVVCDAGVG